jgi:hypothetical protein
MFKKIEIWVVYLIILFGFLVFIIFGAMIKREISGASHIPIITPASKIALYFANIPSNIKKIINPPTAVVIDRYPDKSGFNGVRNNKEVYLLLSRYDTDLSDHLVELIDLRTFKILHTWNPNIESFKKSIIKNENSNEYRLEELFRLRHPFLTSDGSIYFLNNRIYKINLDGSLAWYSNENYFHHSLELDYKQNIWVPGLNNSFSGYKDAIINISIDGRILFEKNMLELFIENNLDYLVFAIGANFNHHNLDPFHINDIQPVLTNGDYWKKGDVFISLRNQSMLLLYRPSENKIIWKGTGFTYYQHDVNILNKSQISIFNNNYKKFNSNPSVDQSNQVLIYDFSNNNYSEYHSDQLQRYSVKTEHEGLSEILNNGDMFIEETIYGRALYFNFDGTLRWQYINKGKMGYTGYLNWSRILYKSDDIEIVRNVLKIKESTKK